MKAKREIGILLRGETYSLPGDEANQCVAISPRFHELHFSIQETLTSGERKELASCTVDIYMIQALLEMSKMIGKAFPNGVPAD